MYITNGMSRVKGKGDVKTVQASSIIVYVKWSLKKRTTRINSHIDLYIVAKCYIGSSIFFFSIVNIILFHIIVVHISYILFVPVSLKLR